MGKSLNGISVPTTFGRHCISCVFYWKPTSFLHSFSSSRSGGFFLRNRSFILIFISSYQWSIHCILTKWLDLILSEISKYNHQQYLSRIKPFALPSNVIVCQQHSAISYVNKSPVSCNLQRIKNPNNAKTQLLRLI